MGTGPCRKTHTNRAADRPPDTNKHQDTQKPVSGHSPNPDPQDAQTARDRADEDDRSTPRLDSTDRPTERLTHPPRGNLPPQSAVGAARRAQRAAEAGGLHRPRRRPRRQSAISAAARACPLLEGRPKPPYGQRRMQVSGHRPFGLFWPVQIPQSAFAKKRPVAKGRCRRPAGR